MAIGILNGDPLFKYGKTSRIYERDYKEHRGTFGKHIKVVLVLLTDNNDEVEKIFKRTILLNNVGTKMVFNNKMRDELFITNDNFTLSDAINEMKKIVEENPLKAIEERDNKIKELIYMRNNDKDIIVEQTKQIIAKEQTKQEELKLQRILAEIELKKLEKDSNDKYKKNNQDNTDDNMDTDVDDNIDTDDENEGEKLYLDFINECTETNPFSHIFFKEVYDRFAIWLGEKYPDMDLPSKKCFGKYMRLYKNICNVKIKNRTQAGFKNLKLK